MAVAFTRVSLWLWGAGGGKETLHRDSSSSGASTMASSSSSDFGFKGRGPKKMMRSARPRRKWQSREERWRKVDKEFDIVIVPSDGGIECISGSESDSDWSIGWLEPHAPEFFADGAEPDAEPSFAVLVPCYGRRDRAAVDLSPRLLPEGTLSVEQLLSALKNSS